MLNLLQLAIFILISQEMHTNSQTTTVYDKQHYIQEEFMQLLDDPKEDVISEGAEFISSLIRNGTEDSLLPMTLGHYCLLQTIWALASGDVELAETYLDKTVLCYDSASEEWLGNFHFNSSLVFDLVKSTSESYEENEILKQIAVSLSQKYNVLTKAAEIADDSLIIWLKKAGLDLTQNGSKAITSAWVKGHIDTVSLLLEMGALESDSASDVMNISNSKGETLLHFAASRGKIGLANQLLDGGAAVDQKDVNSSTPLYHAVWANEKEMVIVLLQRGAAEHGYTAFIDWLIQWGTDVNYKTSSGNTLLHVAVNRGSLDAARNLIKHGALVDVKNSEDLTPLYLAAKKGNPDLIWFLLNKGASLHDSTSGDSLLHTAARRGDTAAIESLVNLCIPVDELNEKNVTPLYSAASAGNRAAMELLLAKGADLYITLRNGQRLLHAAAVDGNTVAIESLLNVGMYVDVRDTDILTGLCRAVQNDNIASVRLLVEKGANTSFRTSVGDTLLHIAAVSNSYESIHLLVELGLDIDSENDQNETPLYLAAKNGNTNSANLLITLGSNKNYVTSKGSSLAHLAAARDDEVALKTLFNIGTNFNVIDSDGYTPLYTAIRKSEMITANIMLETGVELFYIDLHNDSLLHVAARNKDHDVIDFLIDKGVYIDVRGSNGYRPIDVALYKGNCDTAEYFVKKGANVRGRNGMYQTVLHSAVTGGCYSFLKNIAANIDNIDPKDQNLQTPLHLAAVLGRNEVSETLILLGADVNSVDIYNSTPFQIAAVNRNWDMVSSFLKKDVNLDWTDDHKRTLLHLAALENREEVVKYLTRRMRVDIYVQDIDGRIPLHLAAEKGWSGIMSYLFDENVPESINYRDYEGKTPLHFAAIGGHESTVEYLLSKGAEPLATDLHRITPLIYSATFHHWSVSNRLLSKSCMLTGSVDSDEEKKTVLHFAVLDERFDFISSNNECLKKYINRKDLKDQTPVDLAVALENRDIVRYFFENFRFELVLGECIALKLANIRLWDVIRSLSATEVSGCRDEKNRTLLHLAAWHGDDNTVLFLLQNRINDVDAMDTDNHTALHLAAMENRHVVVGILLEYGARKHIHDKDVYNRTILHYAAINGQKEIIENLLENTKMGINAKDVNLDTPLQLVVAQNNISGHDRQEILERLVRHGADWSVVNGQKRNILHLVTVSGDEETLKYILDRYKLDINGQDIDLRTPLHLGIISEHYIMVGTLLRYGADSNLLDMDQYTPLVYAIMNRYDAEDLLDKFTDLDWSDSNNRSILHLGAMHGCSGVVQKFLNLDLNKVNIDRLDINEQTPLHLAAREDHYEVVDLLLQHGANGSLLDKERHSPLNLAVINNSWKAVEMFLKRGYYKEHRYSGNRTLLHLAIINGLRDIIDYLINNEIIDLTATDDLGDTPLHIAARKNDAITVQQLLDKRVEKNVPNDIGQNPLTVAMVNDSWEVVRVLLKGNCDVEGVDGTNRTLLHYAVMNGKKEIIDHLLSCRNVDINALDINHETPLDLLLRNQTLDLINDYSDINWRDGNGRTYLHRGLFTLHNIYNFFRFGTIDAVDNKRQTPLHFAILESYSQYPADQLLRWGASINAFDINGHSPMHLAAMHGNLSVIELFLGHHCHCDMNQMISWIYSKYYSWRDVKYYSWRDKIVDLRINTRDLLGRTPFQLSLDYGHKKIATLLKTFGAKI